MQSHTLTRTQAIELCRRLNSIAVVEIRKGQMIITYPHAHLYPIPSEDIHTISDFARCHKLESRLRAQTDGSIEVEIY